MRLRLSIQRHLLPPTDILWSTDTSNPHAALTIAQLVEQVNEAIPLEHDHWGLEDYVAEVNGYECIHYFRVKELLKDEDEVVIRPLEKHERRLRARSGRTQISESGLHLIDGTPFGKQQQLSRNVNRPLVRIPQPELLLRDGEETETDTESSAVEIVSPTAGGRAGRLLGNGEPADIRIPKRKRDEFTQDEEASTTYDASLKKRKSVKFDEVLQSSRADRAAVTFAEADDESDDDDGDDDDYDANGDFQPDSDDSDTDEDGDADQGVSDGESESSDDETESSSASSSLNTSSSLSSQVSSSSSITSEPRGVNKIKNQQSPKKASTKIAVTSENPNFLVDTTKRNLLASGASTLDSKKPGQGLRKTFIRNKRRRDAKRLRYLKTKGILPAEATLADLKDCEGISSNAQGKDTLSTKVTDREQPSLQSLNHDRESILDRQEQQVKLDPAASNGIAGDTPSGSSSTAKAGIVTPKVKPLQSSSSSLLNDQNDRPSPRTSKLDIDSSRRMVFNSLGYRNPKNESDEERISAKIMASSRRNPVHNTAASQPATSQDSEKGLRKEYPDDPEYWKSKINLYAVECGDEEIDLPDPPFPFKQGWHKQRLGQSAGKEQYGKTRKRKSRNSLNSNMQNTQNYNGANGDHACTDNIVLNYDDEEATDGPAYATNSYATTNTNTTITNGSNRYTVDLPSVPDDPTTLPIPTAKTLTPGAILAFKLLELSSATNWEPRVSPYKVARLDVVETDPARQVGGGGARREDETELFRALTVELAKRDSPPRKRARYDGKGRRIYAKFEMEGFDDDDYDDYDYDDGDGGDGEVGYDDDGAGAGAGGGDETTGSKRVRGKTITVEREEVVDLRLLRAAAPFIS